MCQTLQQTQLMQRPRVNSRSIRHGQIEVSEKAAFARFQFGFEQSLLLATIQKVLMRARARSECKKKRPAGAAVQGLQPCIGDCFVNKCPDFSVASIFAETAADHCFHGIRQLVCSDSNPLDTSTKHCDGRPPLALAPRAANASATIGHCATRIARTRPALADGIHANSPPSFTALALSPDPVGNGRET